MRFIFKTNYNQDIDLVPHSGYGWSYGLLLAALVAAPFLIGPYVQSQIVFVFIYAIVAVGLMILAGFTGLASLGHAAFLAIGAYTAAVAQKYGVPFPVYLALAGAIAGLVGVIVAFPALRLQGIYLVIATMAFGFLTEELIARWESVTHGNEGLRVKTATVFGFALQRDSNAFYFLTLAVLVGVIVVTLNLLRSPTGRAMIAVRDSETAARSMGIDVAKTKVKAFGLSAAITGIAGALFALKMTFISPEMFTLALSIEFIMMILIGGAGSLHGAVLGAIFVVMIDPFLTLLKDDVPRIGAHLSGWLGAGPAVSTAIHDALARWGSAPGLKGAIYGAVIMAFILFEPHGLYGRWLKIKLFFQLFPLYKRATFTRQKMYMKSERVR